MSIEPQPDLDVDRVRPGTLAQELKAVERHKSGVVTLTGSVQNWETMQEAFCALRADGFSSLLLLRKADPPIEGQDLVAFLAFLRDWDQLLLRNILELGGGRIPARFQGPLQQESKTELKWFQEWQAAVSDPRIHRYPGLPWRSFLRKVNAENFAFAQDLLAPGSSESLEIRVEDFLLGKKKTICVFPKNWGKK